MPKGDPQHPKRLDFWATPEMRMQVIALSYLLGEGGKHASVCRRFLGDGIQAFLENMTADEKQEYAYILARVKIAEDPKAMKL